jgi:glycerol-3-phosphate cytidylyltransferase-like family protein
MHLVTMRSYYLTKMYSSSVNYTRHLLAIVNNDHQRGLKGNKEFQDENGRITIVSNIKAIDKAFLSIDTDRTVCATIKMIAEQYGAEFDLGFANGGDQNNETIPEKPVCEQMNVALIVDVKRT